MRSRNSYITGLLIFFAILFSASAAQALVLHAYDFEGGLGPYTVTNGTWEGGSPTAGPAACHGGSTGCAGTVLNGNYTDNVHSNLVSPEFYIPAVVGGEEVHLRYWEWFSYGYADQGTVEVSEFDPATSTWSAFTPVTGAAAPADNAVANASTVWARKDVDLTAYAGKTVKIAFHHYSAFGGVGAGWYIDDIVVETIAAPALFTGEDFEAGWRDWSTNRGTWEVGATRLYSPERCKNGTQCAGTVLNGNYSDDMNSYLTSRSVVFPAVAAGEELHLRYWEWFSYGYADKGTVEVSEFDPATSTWSAFTEVTGAAAPADNAVANASTVWARKDVDLTAYAGKTVRIAFHHYSALGGVGLGWYIDDITLDKIAPSVFTGENFETGWGDWSTNRGTWEVGTAGSWFGGCKTGTGCAATVLSGSYSDSINSYLTSRSVVMPAVAAGEELHMRYWEVFSYGYADKGTVEVSEFDPATSTWSAFTEVTGAAAPADNAVWNTSSGNWSRKDVDLTAYAGKTVRIAFHHYSTLGGVSQGWFIDDITLDKLAAPSVFIGEDFEYGWKDWYTNRGTWEVGTPFYGSLIRCKTGTGCAGTVLKSHYSDNTNSYFISRSVILPGVAAGEELHLRYWEWFSYGYADKGTLEVSEFDPATSTWSAFAAVSGAAVPADNSVYNSSSNVWTRKDVDLTAYAGKTVRIAFHHYSTLGGVGAGWFIDDITVAKVTPLVPPPFTFGDFELGWGDWFTNRGTWEVGTPTAGPAGCKTGTQCAGTVLNGNYYDAMDSLLTSRSIVMPAVSGSRVLQLRFATWYSYGYADKGTVEVSEFDPATGVWSDFTVVGTNPIASGTSSGWTDKIVDLTAYSGKTIRIAFHHYSALGGVSSGWYIDDARIAVSPVAVGVFSGGEGSLISLDGSSSYDPDGTVASYAWDLNNDGVYETTGNPVNLDATAIDGPAIRTIRLKVTDNDWLTDTLTGITVTINNVAPTVNANGPYSGSCNVAIPLHGSATDPAAADTHTYAWDLDNNGTYETAGQNPSATFAAYGSYTVGLQVTDDDGGVGTDTAMVSVTCPPTAVIGGPYPGDEGTLIPLNGSGSSDTDGTVVTYEWDLDNNGSFETTGNPVNFDATAKDGPAGPFTVKLRVVDNDGEVSPVVTTTVTVNNVVPTANANGDYTGTCGVAIPLTGSNTDYAGDTHTYAWDLDNNGSYETAGQNPSASFAAFGSYTVGLQVTDDDGAVGTDTATVTVSCPPTADAGGPYNGAEGTLIPLNGSSSSDPDGTISTYEWDLDNDGSFETTGNPVNFDARNMEGPAGPYDICLRVTDNDAEVSPIVCTTVSIDIVKDELLVNFPTYGLYAKYNDNGGFVRLHQEQAALVTTGDLDGNGINEVIANFTAYGIYARYNNAGGWVRVHKFNARNIDAIDLDGNGSDELIVNFVHGGTEFGVWARYNDSTWTRLHGLSPLRIATGDLDGDGLGEVIGDFDGLGIWSVGHGTPWTRRHPFSSEQIATGDLDGNGSDELIVDFVKDGTNYGIWSLQNGGTWNKLHGLSPLQFIVGDIDGDGNDEVIGSFDGGRGVWKKSNGSGWSRLYKDSPALMSCGDMNGNGAEEFIAIDLGASAGIWVRYDDGAWTQYHSLSPDLISTGNIDNE